MPSNTARCLKLGFSKRRGRFTNWLFSAENAVPEEAGDSVYAPPASGTDRRLLDQHCSLVGGPSAGLPALSECAWMPAAHATATGVSCGGQNAVWGAEKGSEKRHERRPHGCVCTTPCSPPRLQNTYAHDNRARGRAKLRIFSYLPSSAVATGCPSSCALPFCSRNYWLSRLTSRKQGPARFLRATPRFSKRQYCWGTGHVRF
jgi:hypothetical protein